MNLGVRAHDFGQLPLEELAARIARHGLTCVQLAPPKALTGCDADANGFSPAFAGEVRAAFARHGIVIAVLGCYINLGDPDDGRQRPSLDRFKAYLRAARDFGCNVVGTETGSVNADFSWHPDNHGEAAFQTVLGRVRELAREAERCGVCVGVEGVERYVISSPRRLRRLIDEVNSPSLRVIFDPVNLLDAKNHVRQDEITAEALALLGDRIAIVHAKDFRVARDRFEEVPAGNGDLRYAPVLRWLKARRPEVPVLLENTSPATIAGTARFMRDAFKTA